MQIPPLYPQDSTVLQRKSVELERAFLTEMLRHAGISAPEGAFGAGIGGEQFASFLREAQAGAIVDGGGIGLAERLFESLVERAR
ncbi:rod-binding protein [Rhodobacteraceae bacterium HSP-20]|uniref:Rod-binding protein n=1 Tax=Paragemmobacter amnigenus TaxID=2852097 RepID=A0ABS6J257_9RHOB|nr:rod-binding protein [Rhodobacter amnigenus]MBU9697835.1 rod-binding protein [Rhodobacter amnigenus]MBV4389062.1 rod-binding protein [Rhodobacter amnigenus]